MSTFYFVICKLCTALIRVLEGVQFLSDELSEVSNNLKLTVQFLIADFAAVSELSGKNLR